MQRGNSFTFLRLAFALAVVFSHSFVLGGFGEDPLSRYCRGQIRIGEVAVICFFVVSGFLITASAMRQPTIGRFAVHRAARVLPGFWAVQLLTVFVLAPAITLARYGDEIGYFDSLVIGPNSAVSYLWRNAAVRILQYPITNVFHGNPGGDAINGSLWSLAPELTCYICLGLLSVLGGLRWKFTGLACFVAAYLLHVVSLFFPDIGIAAAGFLQKGGILSFQVPLFRSVYLAFLAGMAYYQLREVVRWKGWLAAIATVVAAATLDWWVFDLVLPLTLPYVVLYLAHRLPFERVEKWGDFSYGIYIYAFPIQQCLAKAHFQRFGLLAFMDVSLLLAVLAGMASWLLLERRVLNWARAFRQRPPTSTNAEVTTPLKLLPEKR